MRPISRRTLLAASGAAGVGSAVTSGCSPVAADPIADEAFMRAVVAALIARDGANSAHWADWVSRRLRAIGDPELDIARQGLAAVHRLESRAVWQSDEAVARARQHLSSRTAHGAGDDEPVAVSVLLIYTILAVAPGFLDDLLGFPVSEIGERCRYWDNYDEPVR